MHKAILISTIFFLSNAALSSAQTISWYGYKGLDSQLQKLGMIALDTTKIKVARLDTMLQHHDVKTFISFEQIDKERQVTCDVINVLQHGGNQELLFTLKKGDKVKLLSQNIVCHSMCIYDTAIKLENGEVYLIHGAESLKDTVW